MSFIDVRREIAWYERAKANTLPPSAVGGTPIPERPKPRRKRNLAPITESELRLMDGNR